MLGEWMHPRDYMRKVSRNALCTTMFVFFALAVPARNFAQDPPSPPPDKPAAPADKPPTPKTNADNATQNAPDQPKWDPLRAEKDMQVGEYYMHKGDLDAAIDRFEDATLRNRATQFPFGFWARRKRKKG
jgi:hypothetical protein